AAREMVAGAGLREGVHPAFAIALLAIVIIGAVASVLLTERTDVFLRVKPPKPPAALIERAQEHLRKVGYTMSPADASFGFTYDSGFLSYLEKAHRTRDDKNLPESLAIQFWYRQSPRALERSAAPFPAGSVSVDDPLMKSGEALVVVDVTGQLRMLHTIPPEVQPPGEALEPDWSPLFVAAGLDSTQWTKVTPEWTPSTY